MTKRRWWAKWLTEEVQAARTDLTIGEDYVPTESMEEFSDEDLAAMKAHLDLEIRAMQTVRTQISNEFGARLGDGKAKRIGDRLYRVKRKKKPIVNLEPDQMVAMFGAEIHRLFPMSGWQIRKSAIKPVAEKLGLDPEAVYDTVYSEEWGDYEFSDEDITFAPKKFHDMKDGEVR